MISAKVVALFCLAGGSIAVAQLAGSSWKQVEALPAGTKIRLSVEGRPTTECSVVSVAKDLLICTSTRSIFFFPVHRRMEFARTEVKSVKLSRRPLSMLTGAAIGIGAGAGIGAGVDAQQKTPGEDGHLVPVLFGFLGGMLGAGIGNHGDFLAGPTVYKAP